MVSQMGRSTGAFSAGWPNCVFCNGLLEIQYKTQEGPQACGERDGY